MGLNLDQYVLCKKLVYRFNVFISNLLSCNVFGCLISLNLVIKDFHILQIMRCIALLIFFSSHFLKALDPNGLHPFTDVDGRTLEAKFIKAGEDSVTIEWNGKQFDLPFNSLDAETKALARLLARTKPDREEKSVLQNWTDSAGRTIQAKFIEADETFLTLEWNGKKTTLPLSMFSEASRNLAKQMQKDSVGNNQAPTEAPSLDLSGELNLEKEYPWQNKSGQVASGLFMELSEAELKISMNRGSREVIIPLDSLNENSVALAKKLQALLEKENKQAASLAKKRKALKVPAVTEAELEIEHEFKNLEGQVLKAQFIEADERMVSLLMKKRSSSPFKLAWTSFDSESVAKLEALRRKRVEMDNAKPRIIPAKGNRLSYYGSGKYKGYNTVFEDEAYAVGVPSTGTGLHIFVKQEAVENGVPASLMGVLRMSIGFSSRYTDRTNPERPRTRSRGIKSFDSSPDPSTERDEIKLTGKFTNEGTFEFNIRMTRKGLEFWSKIKDPSGEKWPTSHRVGMSLRGVVPGVKDMTMNQIKPIIGDGAYYASPTEGKTIRLPMGDSWVNLMKKVPRGALGNLKSVEAKGLPYNPLKIVVTPYVKDMRLVFDRSYSHTYPLQGMSLYYYSLVKKTEIPRNRALKINLLPK